MSDEFAVVILGAGPAGLFAADRLAGRADGVVVIDAGPEPAARTAGVQGVGGAGLFSDGKLNLSTLIGGDPASFGRSHADVQPIIDGLDARFTELGVPPEYSGVQSDPIRRLRAQAHRHGVEFLAGKQRHIGTDHVPDVVTALYDSLRSRGIRFRLNSTVEGIARLDSATGFVLKLAGGSTVRGRYLIASPGRAGAYWLRQQAQVLGAVMRHGPIDIGARVEFPDSVYTPIREVMYDAKFRLHTETYDDLVRTFCTNPSGFVTVERYDGFVLVNGHASKSQLTTNTNLALLARMALTDPIEDSSRYGRMIAELTTTLGGGRPLVQRLKDLRAGRRSTWPRIARSAVEPTLRDATPGDLGMALPNRVVKDLLEALARLDGIIEGINADGTLLYAPEIKFYETLYEVTPEMETTVPGFFVAGDASGHSRGIIFAALNGILAADAIRRREGYDN
ncbi:MAG: FAD-dependent oxidoreductase [Planctomycetes bacterium]|nr:FAD-dependent oxidoreductase [Planctomycetota bacterium]